MALTLRVSFAILALAFVCAIQVGAHTETPKRPSVSRVPTRVPTATAKRATSVPTRTRKHQKNDVNDGGEIFSSSSPTAGPQDSQQASAASPPPLDTPSAVPTDVPTASASALPTVTARPSPTVTPTPTGTPSATVTRTRTVTRTATVSRSPSASPTASPTRSPTGTPGKCGDLLILWVGNSYTYVNDLPAMFASLAKSGNKTVCYDSSAFAGWTLDQHLNTWASPSVAKVVSRPWDIVVLQEQSQIPSNDWWCENSMYPSARGLDALVKSQRSRTLFFDTWGRQFGLPSWGFPSFENMNTALYSGYEGIRAELRASMAPVGLAWQAALTALATRPATLPKSNIVLFQSDQSHPTVYGTYLAACTFYASTFKLSPVGLSFRPSGVSADDALLLQQVAASTVLGAANLAKFNL